MVPIPMKTTTRTQLELAWTITMESGWHHVKSWTKMVSSSSGLNTSPIRVVFTFTIDAEGTIWTPVEPYEYSVDVNVKYSADCQIIRFKLVTLVPVDVIKIDDAHNLLDDWTMVAKPASGNWFWGAAPATEGTTGLVDPDADPAQNNPDGHCQAEPDPRAVDHHRARTKRHILHAYHADHRQPEPER